MAAADRGASTVRGNLLQSSVTPHEHRWGNCIHIMASTEVNSEYPIGHALKPSTLDSYLQTAYRNL